MDVKKAFDYPLITSGLTRLWNYTGSLASSVGRCGTSVQTGIPESQFLQKGGMRLPRPSDSVRACPRERQFARDSSLYV